MKKSLLSLALISIFGISIANAGSLEDNGYSFIEKDKKTVDSIKNELPSFYKQMPISSVIETDATPDFLWFVIKDPRGFDTFAINKKDTSIIYPEMIKLKDMQPDSVKNMVKESFSEKNYPVTMKDLNDLPFIEGGTKGKPILHVFTDPECPFCKRLKTMISENSVDKNFEIRYHLAPLPMHQAAIPLSELILSADKKNQEYILKIIMAEKPSEENLKKLNDLFVNHDKNKDKNIEKAREHYSKNMKYMEEKNLMGVPRMYFEQNGKLKTIVGADPEIIKKYLK